MGKSVFIPTQCITFSGFVFNSNEMTVSLPPTKAIKLQSKAVELLSTLSPTMRAVSEVIGLMVVSFPGVCMDLFITDSWK